MTRKWILAFAVCVVGSVFVWGQDRVPNLPAPPANPPAISLQAPADPGFAALIATCRTSPPPRGAGPGGRGGGPQPEPGPREYTVTAISGVIDAGARWTFLWQEAGNNGDGIVGTNDGALLIAQNDKSSVLRLDANGSTSTVYSDTHTGGSLSISAKGGVFIVQRGLKTAIMQLAPRRAVLANSHQGDPLECAGTNPNDLSADSRGGVYFTQVGVFYANSQGVVARYGMNITPNGIILSADEKRLYVTNGPTLAAFDVQPDGSLTNQREFANLDGGGNGDGLAIDAAGRIYVTSNPGVQVISPEGKYLGIIPAPRGVISVAFGGKDKKTLYVLARGAKDANGAEVANAAQVYSIQMLAHGYMGRAK